MNHSQTSSNFKPLSKEANFAAPIEDQVAGGMDIAPECVTRHGHRFVMVNWPKGLPRHEKVRTARFPHGLMKYGETMRSCAQRLIKDQLGMHVLSVKVLEIESYTDDKKHWHLEPILLVQVGGKPKLPKQADKVIYFDNPRDLPSDSIWNQGQFVKLVKEHKIESI